MKYFTTYKCAMCGCELRYGKPQEIPQDDLPGLLGKIVSNQRFMGNPYLYQAPMYIPHKCNDGSAGMAYFSGFRRAQ